MSGERYAIKTPLVYSTAYSLWTWWSRIETEKAKTEKAKGLGKEADWATNPDTEPAFLLSAEFCS